MSKRSNVLAEKLLEELKPDFSTATLAFDSNGDGVVTVGPGTAGSDTAVIRIKDIATIAKDSLNLAQETFGPSVAQICLELSATSGVTLMTASNTWKIAARLLALGCSLVELYASPNTQTVTVADITAANFVVAIPASHKYRLLSGQ